MVGLCYAQGIYLPQDPQTAEQYYRQSFTGTCAPAGYELAEMLLSKKILTQNDKATAHRILLTLQSNPHHMYGVSLYAACLYTGFSFQDYERHLEDALSVVITNLNHYLQKYLETARTRDTKPTQVRMFYVPATGSVRQNNLLIQCVVWLQKTHWLGQQHLDQILDFTPPLLRLSTMVEKSPGDGDFVERTFDLIQTAINCQAKDVLERLLSYIDFTFYDKEAINAILEQP